MAGDWMKIELELPDKPEVHAIANNLNIDPDAVVGKLIRVWQWFDKHTTDGNAFGVSYSLLDRISNVSGFGEAMMFVGWMEQNDKNLTMPKFDRHTSESAKQRALTAKRVKKHASKSNAETNDVGVRVSLPREEKRRVYKNPSVVSVTLDNFDIFWQAYPRHLAKADAIKAWKKHNPDLQAVLAALAWQKKTEDWTKDEGKFIPYPASYLNAQRWLDEPTISAQPSQQSNPPKRMCNYPGCDKMRNVETSDGPRCTEHMYAK